MAGTTARNNKSHVGARRRLRLLRLDAGRATNATAHQFARLV